MRTEGDFIKVNKWLLPLSWIYEAIVRFRNLLFDCGALESRSYQIPVISVGNITVGGTGKTPHVEYLIRLLQDKYNVTVLSRGYKRKSKGYILASPGVGMRQIGDEPYQMANEFPGIHVAVDKDRRHGIERIISDSATKSTDVILLDDAYQHRYVKPKLNILLVDYHHLVTYDRMLPAGRLREPVSGKKRADVVIVTKCPKNLTLMEYRVLTKALDLYPYQTLFFTTISYCGLRPVFGGQKQRQPKINKQTNVLLLTGIASPRQMVSDLSESAGMIRPLAFVDHHQFTKKDVDRINAEFGSMQSPKIIITTEKDRTRLENLKGFSTEVKNNMFSMPIKVRFLLDGEEKFNKIITDYVRKDSRNSSVAETAHVN